MTATLRLLAGIVAVLSHAPGPPPAAAHSATAPRLYVLCQDAAELAVIDSGKDEVISTLKLGPGPAGLALSRDGRRAFVTHPEAGQISEVDLAALRVRRLLPYPGTPFGIAVDSTGRLFVSDWNRNVLSFIDGEEGRRAGEILVGGSPAAIALSPDGQLLFSANRESDSVSIVGIHDWALLATVPVGRAPFALAAGADGSKLYVANVQGGSLSVIDVARRETVAQVAVGAMPYGVAPLAGDGKVLVSNQQSGTVAIVDGKRYEVVATVKVGRYPEGIVALEDGSKAFVANWFSGDVSVIDVAGKREVKRIRCCAGPRALALGAPFP